MFPANDVLELLDDEPFEPFRIELATGRKFLIERPEDLIVMSNKCYFFQFEGRIAKTVQHLSLANVVRMEPVNGARPR
jgi:hypothetical protein